MYKVIVFAGTSEGYEISRFLSEHGVPVYVSVATDYGKKSLKENDCLSIHAARLDEEAMFALFQEVQPELILDATHPYAAEVTKNIVSAAQRAGCRYERLLRKEGQKEAQAVYVDSTEAAARYLMQTKGNVLLTTGSKELSKFVCVPDYQKRLFARVLSLPSVVEACAQLGFEGRNLISMQGPFSKEMNTAMLRQYDCRYLVTKDTGGPGGFLEKMEAAKECGVIPVVIGRPSAEKGLSMTACKTMLSEAFGLPVKPHVTILGIGMGSEGTLTIDGKRAIQRADLLIGAKRIVDAVALPGQAVHYEYRCEEIVSYIAQHPEYERIVAVVSGDVGFYSGAKKLLEELGGCAEVLCGISSVVYFMAKIGMSWEDAKIVSAHGRDCHLIPLIHRWEKVFAILGSSDGVRNLAKKLTEYGMGEVLLYVGENLSYGNEKIICQKASLLLEYEGDALSVVCACHPGVGKTVVTHGLPDAAFLRGAVPMTKEEVRAVSLAKLRLHADSVCYDVGAGTGSVSIEMARLVSEGAIYAIEKKPEAVELLDANRKKFAADHLKIIHGVAPEAMRELPPPTHAFIGGSSGNLKEICRMLLEKNPLVRIVVNCITLETVSEALEVIRELDFTETEVVSLAVARSKNVGRYHMMTGENPIYVIALQKGDTHEDS